MVGGVILAGGAYADGEFGLVPQTPHCRRHRLQRDFRPISFAWRHFAVA